MRNRLLILTTVVTFAATSALAAGQGSGGKSGSAPGDPKGQASVGVGAQGVTAGKSGLAPGHNRSVNSIGAAAAAELAVGRAIVNASGENVGTIDKVITGRDGTVEKVFIRTPNSNRRGTTTRILPARAVNIREGNVITTLSPGELNRMPTE